MDSMANFFSGTRRDDLVDLVGSYQFDDQVTDSGDVFARDPYILRFQCHHTGVWSQLRAMCARPVFTCVFMAVLKDLVMIPVHTKPDDSETELDELFDVFEHVKMKWRTDVRFANSAREASSTE